MGRLIRAGQGSSKEIDPARAARSAVGGALENAGTDGADCVFVFTSSLDEDACRCVLDEARKIAGTDRVVGCTGMGVLSSAGEMEHMPAVTALGISGEEVEVEPFLFEGAGAVDALTACLEGQAGGSAVLVLFPDASVAHPVEVLSAIERAWPGLPVVGGAPAGTPADPEPRVWCGGAVSAGGICGVLLRGAFTAITAVAQGCQPFGQAYTVTRAEGNVVREIAFAPAVDALKEALDTLPPDQKENVGPAIFAGLAMDEYATRRGRGDFLIRNIVGIGREDGSIAIGDRVAVGQTVQFNLRTAEAAHEDLEQAMRALGEELTERDARFGLYFNCLGRGYGLFGRPDHDTEAIRRHLGPLPVAGFFGNAEIAPVAGRNHVHSYTGAMVVIAEDRDG